VFDFAMRTITYFLDSSLVIILILGFFLPLLLFALIILLTLSADKDRNASLIHKTLSIFDEMLVFEGFEAFLTTFSLFLIGGGTTGKVVGGVATEDRVAVGARGVVPFYWFVDVTSQ